MYEKYELYVYSNVILCLQLIGIYLGVVLDLFKSCDQVQVHVVISSFSHFLTEPIQKEEDYKQILNWAINNCSVQQNDSITQFYSVANCHEFKHKVAHVGSSIAKSPKKIALASIRDPYISTSMTVLPIRSRLGLEKPIFIHLNDEMPWQKTPFVIQSQIAAYQQAFKVFRTVYYDVFQSTSSYLPVRSGPLLTASFLTPSARKFNKHHSAEDIAHAYATRASTRPVLCSFAGGIKYTSLGGRENQERLQMAEVFQNSSHCNLFLSDSTQLSDGLSEYEYIELMRVSVFVLCPTGLNPETQRPHQALDLGVIPLTLRVSESAHDYLSGIYIYIYVIRNCHCHCDSL